MSKLLSEALPLIGWQNTIRLTSEDVSMLEPVCERVLDLDGRKELTPERIDELASDAYKILNFQVVGVQEVSDYISMVYYNSKYFKPLLPLIDEAVLCFYRGYKTAALGLFFIILESYLRSVFGWRPGEKDPKFKDLRDSVLSLPDSTYALQAHKILQIVYSRYAAISPTQFHYNRHGLLHGIRGKTKYDGMNCARIIQLFNLLCAAENVERIGYGDCLEMMKYRYATFENCTKRNTEMMLTSIVY